MGDSAKESPVFRPIKQRAFQQGLKEGIKQSIDQDILNATRRAMEQGIVKGIERAMDEGLKLGAQEGSRQTLVESTMAILKARFPEGDTRWFTASLEAITDLDRLKALNLNAAVVTSIDDFRDDLMS